MLGDEKDIVMTYSKVVPVLN